MRLRAREVEIIIGAALANCRDVGGLPTDDGRRTLSAVLYRSDAPRGVRASARRAPEAVEAVLKIMNTPRPGQPADGRPRGRSIRAGFTLDRGWRPDATWRAIQLLNRVGLIYDLRLPKSEVAFPPPLCAPTPSLLGTHRDWHIPELEQTAVPG